MGEQLRRRRVRLVGAMLLGTIVNLATALFLIGLAPAERVAQLAVIGFSEALIVSVTWLAFAIVGAIIVRHQPDNVIGWTCAAGGLGPSVVALSVATATYLLALDSGSRPGQFVAWVSHVGAMALFAAPLFLMFRFPTGRPLGPRSARLERLWVGLFIALLVAGAVAPISLVGFTAIPNPFALQGAPRVPFFGFLGASVAALLIAGTATLVVRHRYGSWLERRQIALLGGAAALVAVDAALFPLTSPGFTSTGQLTVATYFVTTLALTTIPIAIGIAIVRYRLYDIDRVVRRTLTYGIVSAVLAVVYVTAVLGLQAALDAVSPAAGNTLATAGSTLLVAALFRPVRSRAQRAIDRRFDRERFEAARAIETFAAQVRGEAEVAAILDELVALAALTVRPLGVRCWLRKAP